MKKRFYVVSMLAAFLLAAGTVRAQTIDDKIKTLEQELIQLKEQQIEIKKEATAAAAAMPEFSYRPANGVTISAADKSWSIRITYQLHMHMQNHLRGEANPGPKGNAIFSYNNKFTTGDIFSRRSQPAFGYFWNDCFYELYFGWDADSNEVIGTQRAEFVTHFEQMHPWAPSLWVSNPGGEVHRYVSQSSISGARVELPQDLLSDGSAHNLGHRAIGIGWRNVGLGQGDVFLAFEFAGQPFSSAGNNNVLAGAVPSGSIENSDNTDAHTFFMKAGTRPFLRSKNKWLEKTKFGFAWSVNSPSLSWASTTRRLRITSTDRVGRLDLMDIRNIGSGIHHRLEYGFEWGVGPYLFRTANGLSSFEDKARPPTVAQATNHKGVHGQFWSINHELFLWSPKGFLTGSSTTPNSILMGWGFSRADASCGRPGCDNSGEFSRNHITQRELDFWYFIRPGLSVGTWWNWWKAANVKRGTTGATPTFDQEAIGCSKGGQEVRGKSCDWHTVNLGVRVDF